MRILIVTSQFPIAGEPNRGRPVYQTIRALAKLATVHVISPVATYPRWAQPKSYLFRAPGPAQAEDFPVAFPTYPVLPLATRPLNGWLCGRTLRAPIAAFAPDVLLSYWMYPDAYGAMQASHGMDLPLVAGARGSDLRVRDIVTRCLTRPVVRAARRLLVVSDDLGQVAVREYAADPGRIRVIRNGCDASLFHPRERAQARAALGIASDAELVIYVGRLVPEKGLRELLEAGERLASSRPRLQVALVGDGPMRAELEQLIAANPGLSVRLAGAQPAAEVARWMAASDLVTLPSYSEGHPNVLVEALACGRPVVATAVGGVPEVIDAGSGILVPAKSAEALATALEAALQRPWDEPALAGKFSRSWEQVAQDTLQACQEAFDEHHGRGGRH